MSISEKLISYIETNLLDGDGSETVRPDDALLDRGLLDSIGLMQIMQFVEEEAGVRIPDIDVTPDNFESVNAIDELVTRLKNR